MHENILNPSSNCIHDTPGGTEFCIRCLRERGDLLTDLLERERGGRAFQTFHGRPAMSFGGAVSALKCGRRVARKGWNGKGMWLVLVHPALSTYTSDAGRFDMMPCIGMKTAQETMQPGWLASQADILAEDWEVLT